MAGESVDEVVCNFNNKFRIKCYIYFVFWANNLFSFTTPPHLNITRRSRSRFLFRYIVLSLRFSLSFSITPFLIFYITLSQSLSFQHSVKYLSQRSTINQSQIDDFGSKNVDNIRINAYYTYNTYVLHSY